MFITHFDILHNTFRLCSIWRTIQPLKSLDITIRIMMHCVMDTAITTPSSFPPLHFVTHIRHTLLVPVILIIGITLFVQSTRP